MAAEEILENITLTAAADLSAKQYYFAKVTADDTMNLAGDGELGYVLQGKTESGQPGAVGVKGVTRVVIGAAVSAGDFLASDAAGKAITAATGKEILGQALEDGSADLVQIRMLIKAAGARAA